VATESFLRSLICGLLLHEVSHFDGPELDGQDLNLLKLEENAVSIIDGWRERIDGNGPLGWDSKRLTIALRIAAVAIAFDHKTSGDGGRPRQPAFDVLREFIIAEHGALDPTIIAAFIRILDH
jgi:HD-GYP domain-containing protein (c-di-GMP phosphodiesterase class II)